MKQHRDVARAKRELLRFGRCRVKCSLRKLGPGARQHRVRGIHAEPARAALGESSGLRSEPGAGAAADVQHASDPAAL